MARTRLQYPHYRLEEAATGLGVAQTLAGYRLVLPRDADRFSTLSAAQIAAGNQALDLVRVDA